jgi:myo-inositol-1(or 4)-monophosphatase
MGTFLAERDAAAQIAVAAGRSIRERLQSGFSVTHKGTVDLVTEADLGAERLIKESLARMFPHDSFYGEEGGGADYRQGRVWVVDPLDGTTNFAHRLPLFAVSIGFFDHGVVQAGAVYQPMSDELFAVARGGGATLNGRPIHVSATHQLIGALGVTGFPYKIQDCLDPILATLREIMPRVQGMRRTGSAALDLCYTACGIFDFFYEIRLNPWDVAAGSLLIEEAGGLITDFSGGDRFIEKSQLIASNGLLHDELNKIIRAIWTPG